jgi:hypothetical protein
MKRVPCLAAVLLFAGFTALSYSQSLGDLARKEKQRREKTGAGAKVITNDDTPKYAGGAITTGAPSTPDKDKKAGDKNAADKPGKEANDEPVDFQGRPESYWRQTFADARKRVAELENEGNVLLLKIADLQNQFYRESDGFKQQSIQREIQKSFYEQDQNKENLAKAKDQLQDLEKEARKSGALPGWITPQK